MRIAMLAPISWPLPPTGYGPWEQVAYNLSEELVKLGHEVTVFAAGGSAVSGRLEETIPHSLSTWPEAERSQERHFDLESGLLQGPPDARVLEPADSVSAGVDPAWLGVGPVGPPDVQGIQGAAVRFPVGRRTVFLAGAELRGDGRQRYPGRELPDPGSTPPPNGRALSCRPR